jgi:hypothetical protein
MMRIIKQFGFTFSICKFAAGRTQSIFRYGGFNSKKCFSSNTTQQNEDNKNNINEENKQEYPNIVKMLFENNVKLKKLPCFEVYASQIEILHQPMDFYLAIIVRIKFLSISNHFS